MTGFGVFSVDGGEPRVGFRAGGEIRDLSSLGETFRRPSLNALLAQGRGAWEDALGRALEADVPRVPLAGATVHLPFEVADYVDFFSSLEHATNAGRLFRPDAEPLQPNWRWLPVAYHGRAGTVVVSGTDVVRPRGEVMQPGADAPVYEPSSRLDIELELGFVVGAPSRAAARFRWATSPTTSSASCSSTTGARATCRRGSPGRSARSSASRSRRRSPAG